MLVIFPCCIVAPGYFNCCVKEVYQGLCVGCKDYRKIWCSVQNKVQSVVLCKKGTNMWCYALFPRWSGKKGRKQRRVVRMCSLDSFLRLIHFTHRRCFRTNKRALRVLIPSSFRHCVFLCILSRFRLPCSLCDGIR
jgi:hypothetical protein